MTLKKSVLLGALVGAAALLAPATKSQAQPMWGWLEMCRPGFHYDARRDVCVAKRKARRVYRKRRKGRM